MIQTLPKAREPPTVGDALSGASFSMEGVVQDKDDELERTEAFVPGAPSPLLSPSILQTDDSPDWFCSFGDAEESRKHCKGKDSESRSRELAT